MAEQKPKPDSKVEDEELCRRVSAYLERLRREPLVHEILGRLRQELSPSYSFHSAEHTEDVMHEAIRFALRDGLGEKQLHLIGIAAAYHDAGYLVGAQGHEEVSASLAEQAMRKCGRYTDSEIALVQQMILDTSLTNVPDAPRQQATTELSGYLLDADLSNFGRDDFFERLAAFVREIGADYQELARKTLVIMEKHDWITDSARVLREEKKRVNMNLLYRRLDQTGS